MTTLVRGTIPATDFALADSLAPRPALTVDCERVVASGDGAVLPILWATGVDADAATQAFQADPSVQHVDRLAAFADAHLYRLAWTEQVQRVVQRLTTAATIVAARGAGEQWSLRLLAPERQALTPLTTDSGPSQGLSFDIQTIHTLDSQPAAQYGLTEAQSAALRHAVAQGYYDVPRENDLQELATGLDVSHQALSERLRRATQTLIEDTLRTGPRADAADE